MVVVSHRRSRRLSCHASCICFFRTRMSTCLSRFVSHLVEGCPILRQIYAWHCIVFTSHNNTVQKHNNEESSETIRNLTMLCINLSEYWTSMTWLTVILSFLVKKLFGVLCEEIFIHRVSLFILKEFSNDFILRN